MHKIKEIHLKFNLESPIFLRFISDWNCKMFLLSIDSDFLIFLKIELF